MATAAKATIATGGTNSKTIRTAVTTAMQSITMPSGIKAGVLKNVGTTDIRIRINNTGANYWTIKPEEQTPKILLDGATVEMQAVTSDSILECIFEG